MRGLRGLAAVMLAWAGTAGAEPSLVVLPVQHNLSGDVASVLETAAGSVRERLAAGGFQLVDAGDTATCLPGAVPVAGDQAGLAAAAAGCRAAAAARLEIESSAMGYVLRLQVVSSAGQSVAALEEPCDFCTEGEMVLRWAVLADRVGPPPADLAPPAPVEPVEPVAPVTPVEPVEPIDPLLTEDDGPSVSDVPWWFWTGEALSVASFVAGVALIAIDGETTCASGVAVADCPDLYDTDAGGYTLAALGVAGAAAFGIGLYLAFEDEPDDSGGEPAGAELAILPGLGSLWVRGTFGP